MENLDTSLHQLYDFFDPYPELDENKKLFKNYIRKINAEGLKENTQLIYVKTFKVFSLWCVKPISKLNDEDIYDFLDYLENHTYKRGNEYRHYSKETIKTFKVCLKTFLKSIDKPELAAILKDKRKRGLSKQLDRKELLDLGDFRKMMNAAQSPRDKALMCVLYEAGPRRSELLSSRVCDVAFNDYGCKLTFSERDATDTLKTGGRTVQLVHSAQYLRAWIDVHPCKLQNGKTDPEAHLWVSSYRRKVKTLESSEPCFIYPRLTHASLWEQLHAIARKAGVTKRVNPHAWRHIAATNNAEFLSDAQMRAFFGWTPASPMPGRYTHDPDTDKAVLRAAGINVFEDVDTGLKSIKCPRCSEWNTDKDYCGRCGNPLKREVMTTESELLTSVLKVLTESNKLEELAAIIKNK